MSEQTFVRELERRADDVQPRHFGFEDVRTTAYRIRRRRRIAASAAAAAVVAAVLLVPVMIGGSQRAEEPEPVPKPKSAATTPGVSVLYDGILTRADGSTTPLDIDTADVQQLGVLTDGRVVIAVSNSQVVRVYGSDGTLEGKHRVALNHITMSADDTLAAWVDGDSRVVVLESGVAEPTTFEWGIPMPGESSGIIDAVYGSDCANDGCTVLGGDFNTTTTKLTVRSEAGIDLKTSEPLSVVDVSPDGEQWAVTFPPTDDSEQFGCSGVYFPATDLVTARTCESTYWQFSPDGTHLTAARGDNSMWGSVEVIKWGEGVHPVLTYEPDDGFTVKDWGWADTEHLLVVVAGLDDPSTWSLLRVPIDGGDVETLVGPVDGPNAESPSVFVLSD